MTTPSSRTPLRTKTGSRLPHATRRHMDQKSGPRRACPGSRLSRIGAGRPTMFFGVSSVTTATLTSDSSRRRHGSLKPSATNGYTSRTSKRTTSEHSSPAFASALRGPTRPSYDLIISVTEWRSRVRQPIAREGVASARRPRVSVPRERAHLLGSKTLAAVMAREGIGTPCVQRAPSPGGGPLFSSLRGRGAVAG